MCTLTITYSAHSQAHFWNTCILKVKQKLSFYIFQTELERNGVWKDFWKCPAQSPAQSRVTSKSDHIAQGLVSPNFEAFQA